ncbi:MAG: AI-2E family transporter [Vicinamibacteria bacterium]
MSPAAGPRLRAIRVPPADRAILGGLALLGIILLGSLIYPFASAFLFAAVLAGALYPPFERLTKRLGKRPMLAAGLITFVVAVVVSVPTIWIALTAGREVMTGVTVVDRAFRSGGGVRQIIDGLPADVRERARDLVDRVPGGSEQLQDLAKNQRSKAASVFKAAVVTTSTIVIKVSLMLVAFFYFLVDGKRLAKWIATVAPLPEKQILEILRDFRNVSVAVLFSSLGTAGAQSLAALVGYLFAGVPQPLFFTFVTFIFAFIPAIGAGSVVMGSSVLLFLMGHTQQGIYLALWGICVVSVIDNLVKPWLMKDRMEIHGGLIFFALLGGMATFGPVGFVAGPLILSFFLAVVRLCRQETRAMAA